MEANCHYAIIWHMRNPMPNFIEFGICQIWNEIQNVHWGKLFWDQCKFLHQQPIWKSHWRCSCLLVMDYFQQNDSPTSSKPTTFCQAKLCWTFFFFFSAQHLRLIEGCTSADQGVLRLAESLLNIFFRLAFWLAEGVLWLAEHGNDI